MSTKREIVIAGENIWLCALTGSVAGEKKWSESRTSGGSYGVHGHARIQTDVNTRHEFWLVAPDGEEKCVEFGNSKVSVRENQVLTAVWGSRVGRDSGPFLLLSNHNAQGQTWLIADESQLLKRMGLSNPMLRWTLAGLAAATLCFALVRGSGAILAFFLAAIGGILYGLVQRKAKTKAIREAAAEAVNLELSGRRSASTALGNHDPQLPA